MSDQESRRSSDPVGGEPGDGESQPAEPVDEDVEHLFAEMQKNLEAAERLMKVHEKGLRSMRAYSVYR